jgi:CheY-like chemotaxis protein
VIAEAVGLLRSTIPSMIRLETRIDPACPPVLADGTQIHQVIMNLCTNAWHAVAETDGLIEISLAPVQFAPGSARARAGLAPGTYVQLTIRDNGCGMTPAEQEHLFEPFYTTKPKGRGTGLGLAVVHGIIQGHHGTISVHSIPGLGTRFEILLPALVATPHAAATTAAELVQAGRANRILLVDDDAIALTAVQGQLRHVGYQVTAESDPIVALQRLAEYPDNFDLVLSDFAMAGMTGLQLASKILTAQPQIPVILISGYIEPKQANDILATGVREILRKPVSFAELSKAIARHLGAPVRE